MSHIRGLETKRFSDETRGAYDHPSPRRRAMMTFMISLVPA